MNTTAISRNPDNLVKAGIVLIILSILDALFTDIGIRHNHISEANPLIALLYESSIFSFYAIKIFLPFLLLFILIKAESKPYLIFLTYLTLIIYTLVLLLHLSWIALLFFSEVEPLVLITT